MNINCTECGGLFSEFDHVTCDGCERIVHRLPCGSYVIIERDGEQFAYFFCNTCDDEEGDFQ
jgi:hypothetical protein